MKQIFFPSQIPYNKRTYKNALYFDSTKKLNKFEIHQLITKIYNIHIKKKIHVLNIKSKKKIIIEYEKI